MYTGIVTSGARSYHSQFILLLLYGSIGIKLWRIENCSSVGIGRMEENNFFIQSRQVRATQRLSRVQEASQKNLHAVIRSPSNH
jgi:hypothetical protein